MNWCLTRPRELGHVHQRLVDQCAGRKRGAQRIAAVLAARHAPKSWHRATPASLGTGGLCPPRFDLRGVDRDSIALGHPHGMSGARLMTTAMYQLHRTGGSNALCTMCIGVGQGIAMVIERV